MSTFDKLMQPAKIAITNIIFTVKTIVTVGRIPWNTLTPILDTEVGMTTLGRLLFSGIIPNKLFKQRGRSLSR